MKSVLPNSLSLSSKKEQSSKKNFSTWQEAALAFVSPADQDPNKPKNSSYWKAQLLDAIRKSGGLNKNEKYLLMILLSTQGKDGQLNASNERLAKEMRVSVSTVARTLRSLQNKEIIICQRYFQPKGFITIKRRQINVCWDSLMIQHHVTVTLNSCSSCTLSSSSVLDLDLKKNEVLPQAALVEGCALRDSSSNLREIKHPLSIDERETEQKMKDNIEDDHTIKHRGTSLADRILAFKPSISLTELANQNVGRSTNISEKIEQERKEKRHLEALPRPWEDKPITKESARLQRIQDIPQRYPNYKEVLEREGCTLAEIQARMRANIHYEPFSTKQTWNIGCHPKYAILGEKERDALFVKAVEYWLGESKYGYKKSTRTMFMKGRKQADSCRAEYVRYVAAIYEHYGLEMELWKIGWSTGWEVYFEWVEKGEKWPQARGYRAQDNKIMSKRSRKRGFVKRQTLDEQIEEQREMLKATMADAYTL